MCGRYYIAEDDAAEELRQIIEAVNRKSLDVKTGGEIRPGDTIPVLANSPTLQPGAYAMRWGYTLPDGKLLFMTRSETAADKALFKDGMAQRRCLIPPPAISSGSIAERTSSSMPSHHRAVA